MFDLEEIQKRARAAQEQASASLKESLDRQEELLQKQFSQKAPEESRSQDAAPVTPQQQVQILGQVFDPQEMAQMAANQQQLQELVQQQVAAAPAQGVENIMNQLFGEDMGVLAAALETLSLEDDPDEEEEEPVLDSQWEADLYTLLEDTMDRIGSLPEPEPVVYSKGPSPQWEQFGILLSGILSQLNSHSLSSMDVEEHIPVFEQQVVSLVRRSWGINGREDLLEMIRYLSQEGYIWRYQLYCQAQSPLELLEEDADQEEQEAVARAWRFAQRYQDRYHPGFMAGWDVGRAAMLTRWGSYLGWITPGEATGILWDLSQKVTQELHSWRAFAQSYLFGGLMWKLLCGDSSAASYLGYLANAATQLLTGTDDDESVTWRTCPWPAPPKIGFTL